MILGIMTKVERKNIKYRLAVEDAEVTVEQSGDFFDVRSSFKNSWNGTVQWRPTLKAAKELAAQDYKWHRKNQKKSVPKKLKWIEI